MTDISLTFTVEQVNLILASLAQRPYTEVAELIHRIKIEAETQIIAEAKSREPEQV
jgi:hypothetical protein